MARRALVVHGSHLLDRGYPLVSTDRRSDSGAPTNALFALTQALSRALSFKVPDVAVAVIEASLDTSKMPPALAEQHAMLPRVLEAHGLIVVRADAVADVVASYA